MALVLDVAKAHRRILIRESDRGLFVFGIVADSINAEPLVSVPVSQAFSGPVQPAFFSVC